MRSATLIGGELEKNAAGEERQTNELASAQPRLITGELAHEGVHNNLSRVHCRRDDRQRRHREAVVVE
jgi:hypothetical protein